MNNLNPTTSHWGTYLAETKDGELTALHPYPHDDHPSLIHKGFPSAINDDLRISKPHIRKGWLKSKDRSKNCRGDDSFIPVPWDEAFDIAAEELTRVKDTFGNEAIYAGSYGWASAGRFHHAQSQLHRFLNCFGGFTKSIGTYSFAASETIVPHAIGMSYYEFLDNHTDWNSISENTSLLVMFGGFPLKNSQVTSGGVGKHTTKHYLEKCLQNGAKFININPMQVDSDEFTKARHIPIRPGTDTALMISMAYHLDKKGLVDLEFIDTHCIGYTKFREYLWGKTDNTIKSPEWAEQITGVPAKTIEEIVELLPHNRTMITGAWGLQRQEHGEQPHWMIIVLAAMLGQIGKPGGGFGLGYSSENGIGNPVKLHKWPAFPQLKNNIKTFIPVARVSDMLLNPGEPFQHNGDTHQYPQIHLVYWAGGNPFHHQMDLGKLREAFRQPETIMVNEIWWNSLARHADIVFPATTPLERNDIAMGHWEQTVSPMHKAIDPIGESKSDFDIFSGLADKLNIHELFTDNKDEQGWLHWLWKEAQKSATKADFVLPNFKDFWQGKSMEVLAPKKRQILMEDFRNNPQKNPLKTPSGKIEIFSETVSGFRYDDCPGHPEWIEPKEWLGSDNVSEFPLQLISGQPENRLHSQLDNGDYSRNKKIKDREPVTINAKDAEARGIKDGDIVEIFNNRGRCLAGAVLSDKIMEGVVFLPVGAWYNPLDGDSEGRFCNHGNPNVLTRDVGTSQLGQGPIAHSTLVQIRKLQDDPLPVSIFFPPKIETD